MPRIMLYAAIALTLLTAAPALANDNKDTTYSKTEIGQAVEGFFQDTAGNLAELIEKIFEDQGRPNGYIKGNEAGGAVIAGLRYGEGLLYMKQGENLPMNVYWQGPSIGFDLGMNASKVFTLVYNLPEPEAIFKRFPGVDGSAYVVGGFSMNYQRADNITLAPIRTGVGLRLGANVGYLHYTREKHGNPF